MSDALHQICEQCRHYDAALRLGHMPPNCRLCRAEELYWLMHEWKKARYPCGDCEDAWECDPDRMFYNVFEDDNG